MPGPGPTLIPDHAPLLPENTPFTKQTPKSLLILVYFVGNYHNVTMAAPWEISSRTKWPVFHLEEISKNREPLVMFIRRDFLATHRQTVPGSLRGLVQPLPGILSYVIAWEYLYPADPAR